MWLDAARAEKKRDFRLNNFQPILFQKLIVGGYADNLASKD
jgi:hypothetical protein